MSTPFAVSCLSAVLGVAVGLLGLRASRLPGWPEMRWVAVISFFAAAYGVASLPATLDWPAPLLSASSRVRLAAGLAQAWAWMRYAAATSDAPPVKLEGVVERLLLSVAAVGLLPGVVFSGVITHHLFEPWAATYNDARLTPLGNLLLSLCATSVTVVFGRFARARRSGGRSVAVQVAAFASFLLLVLNDALAASGRFDLPYLLDIGFLLPVGLVAFANTSRLIDTALDLEALRTRLESLVEERTLALAQTQERLVRAERLASLGQLANGVAHQLSNPASVVNAYLHYLAEALPRTLSRARSSETRSLPCAASTTWSAAWPMPGASPRCRGPPSRSSSMGR